MVKLFQLDFYQTNNECESCPNFSELFDARIKQVSDVIDLYEAAHLSSQTREQTVAAIEALHSQNLVLMRATDEEQLVDR